MNGYFVAPDAHDDLWIWRENGDRPLPIISKWHFARGDEELWDAIVQMVEG